MRALVVIAALAASACAAGSQPAGPNADATYPDVQSFCAGYGHAECTDAVVHACGASDGASCENAMAASCIASQPQGTTYVPGKAAACIELAASTYATTTITAEQIAALSVACGPLVFSGPGQARATCASDYDCSSQEGLSCVVPFGQTSGRCYVPVVVQPGEACPDEPDECTAGFYCDPTSKACTPAAAAGAGCGEGYKPCADGFTCVGPGPFAACQPKGADGYPCTLDTDCAGGLCDKASTQGQGTCASQITLSPLDAACTSFLAQ
jgi:hypothetical protein